MTISGPSDATSSKVTLSPLPTKEANAPTKQTPALADPSKLTSRSAVVQALSDLSSYSASLDDELVSLFEESEPVVTDARRSIAALAPQVQLIQEEADVLDRRLQSSASVAKRISERVRLLDEERKRIALATEWAVRVAELKSSLSLLASAVEHRDWDMATMHCRRALAIDPAIRSSQFAAAVVPSTDLPELPETTLLELRKTMLTAFTDAFIRSTQNKDEKEASRFFKLFPQVGWKKEGLEVYSSFARSMVREKGRSITDSLGSGKAQNPTHFALLLTSLFEHLASLIDMHQPVVDRHYGLGNFSHGVMPGLQDECDRLGHRIMDSWREDRSVRRRLDEVQAYRFTGAATAKHTQPSTFKASFGVPGRTASPAAESTANSSFDEPSGPDGREVSKILTELAAMSSRWGYYRRFLQSRLSSGPDAGGGNRPKTLEDERAAQADEALKDFRRTSVDRRSSIASSANAPPIDAEQDEELADSIDHATQSKLGQEVLESMSTLYIPMETWFLRNSLEKAFRIDQPDTISRPYTSSILDDAFYVIRIVLARIMSTSSLATLTEMTRVVKTIVEEDYIEVIVRKMETLWRTISGSMTVDGPRKDAASREMRTVFITYLNVLDVSSTYMSRVLLEVGHESSLARLFEPSEQDEASACVQSLSSLVQRFRSSLRTEIEHLFTQLTAPRLRALLMDTYRDVSYMLDDEAYSSAESRDLVRRRFVKSWDLLFHHFRGVFTDANFNTYLSMALDALLKPWEGMVLGMRFTELGALKFDKDLRAVVGFLTDQTSLPIRDKFTRLQQVSYVLNLDGGEDEGDLYQNAVASGISWRLSMAEVRSVRGLRVT
ncbi:Conserved oligomeric Golgi complex, subunit 4 [Kalmanozyma brasiliensis GHG001]|uniref:Conserved oligomeric Golgi complex subunit 4 n=1 Tax=Kalmanozyma brasiliensis (strain GHG001) TaxID=1365824 RepID=V5GSU0_KALBG|nr:Conserved oligomeric Golgi complex, subunit 4 [Kalmanozyma brasiliensis GHG001]EST08992.1 Conserved oligomeric Golgi complex, subunit 4 [Kalmanozyma brasiliensis GHG001]